MRINEGSSITPPWISGRYYFVPNTTSITATSSLVNNAMRSVPFFVPNPVLLSRIGSEVTVAGEAGSRCRLGIYIDNGGGMPGQLIVDAGQINGDSATVQELTINVGIGPGWYWAASVVQSAPTTLPTMRISFNASYGTLISCAGAAAPTTNVTSVGFQQLGISGALPSTFTQAGVTASAPRVFVKVA